MNWLQIIAPPLLMLLGGIITWIIKSRIEELRTMEENLREKRRSIYIQILEPYIQIFSDPKGKGQLEAIKRIRSYDYRKTAFEMNLFGSDDVVRAYNNLMQHTYQVADTGKQDPKEMLHLYGRFLIEIRKSLGNKKTELDELDMLKSQIKDIYNL